MKANELMIGDWIDNNLEGVSHYIQICSISDDGKICYKRDGLYRDLWLNDNIKPIPITKEILKKNFKRYHESVYSEDFLISDNCLYGTIITIDAEDNIVDIPVRNIAGDLEYFPITEIKYVHQLQHFIKLIGNEKEITI